MPQSRGKEFSDFCTFKRKKDSSLHRTSVAKHNSLGTFPMPRTNAVTDAVGLLPVTYRLCVLVNTLKMLGRNR